MGKLDCPIPGCSKVGLSRQVYVNKHLRNDHNVGLENGVGGNMNLLRKTQQEQFSRWLEANGYANIDLFSGAPIEPQGDGAHRDDNDDDEEEEDEQEEEAATASEFTQSHVGTESTTTTADETGEDVDRQVKVPGTLESLLQMIQTDDKSLLNVRPQHANDKHDIVKENGKLLRGGYGLPKMGNGK